MNGKGGAVALILSVTVGWVRRVMFCKTEEREAAYGLFGPRRAPCETKR
jgi:hypothetical protein